MAAQIVLIGFVLISGGGFFARVVFGAALLDAFIPTSRGYPDNMRPIRAPSMVRRGTSVGRETEAPATAMGRAGEASEHITL
jgi:hypothetical protein